MRLTRRRLADKSGTITLKVEGQVCQRSERVEKLLTVDTYLKPICGADEINEVAYYESISTATH